ncbi:hypothetical protein NQ317_006071 [Molorchus minor]|uniref:Uncharacterized protein n=1 Tax=Molorchus minor TaxID=1323400 RepID=A0ABQ9K400_9CUCU|nr:hypothetical protein NQ317_006071 [Molorchus minor]
MNVDVTADEILEVCPFIVNCTEEYLNDFEEAVEQFENETDTLCKIYEPEVVVDQNAKHAQCFQLNPKEMSQSEIRNHLYGVLMKVSEEGKCTGGNDLPT